MKKIQLMILTNALMLTMAVSAGTALLAPVEVRASEVSEMTMEVSEKSVPAMENFMKSRRHEYHKALMMGQDVPGNGQKMESTIVRLKTIPMSTTVRCRAEKTQDYLRKNKFLTQMDHMM